MNEVVTDLENRIQRVLIGDDIKFLKVNIRNHLGGYDIFSVAEFLCFNCGKIEPILLDASTEVLTGIANIIKTVHSNCEPTSYGELLKAKYDSEVLRNNIFLNENKDGTISKILKFLKRKVALSREQSTTTNTAK